MLKHKIQHPDYKTNYAVIFSNKRITEQSLLLQPIIDKFKEVANLFEHVPFQHVCIELNEQAEKLSKEALSLQEGLLVTTESGNEVSHPEMVITLLKIRRNGIFCSRVELSSISESVEQSCIALSM
jgi:hypothetical protein